MNRRDFVMGNVTGLVVGAGAALGASRLMKADPGTAGAAAPAGAAPDADKAKLSFAQNGEDLFLKQALEVFRVEKPTYIDIGAFDPIIGSNTYIFYRAGCRGVLVEPNPVYVEKLRAVRTGDVVVNAGVGVIEETEADYYIVEGDGQRNTFSKEEVEHDKAKGIKLEKTVKMPLKNVNKIIDEHLHKAPDLFSVDTEGFDLTILKTLDFEKYRPKVFCVEAALENAMINEEIVTFMQSKNYLFRGGNLVNAMFCDRKLFG
jgi:FkbM family methyltransferase